MTAGFDRLDLGQRRTAVNRYDGSTGCRQHTIDLTAYKGTTVQLGFLGISAYGNNEFMDDVVVTTP